mgnify:FL=1|tara:strand:+ start:518 stop:781 length:264 start_codon:yes stop_codon:yes gene_type:complete
MGFLFPSGPSESPEQKASRQKRDQQVQEQEDRTQKAEITERKRINDRMRKMKTGGMRQLLSSDREDNQALGNPITQTRTLGPGRNPR